MGVIGLSFDSAFAADYVLDESFCENQMNGSWNNAASPRLGGTCTVEEYGLESGNTLEIPFHVELRMIDTQPTLGIHSGAILNIAGKLTIEQDYDDMSTYTGIWQGISAIGNFGEINALDSAYVDIFPDLNSVFNFGSITISSSDADTLEYGLTSTSSGSVENFDYLEGPFVDFTGQRILNQATCENVLKGVWGGNTCTSVNWIIFENDSELTIPIGTTWELKSTGGGYNISNDAGTIINEGRLIINSGKSYPFVNEGTFINKGIFKIQKSVFYGFINEGITENYGLIESSDFNRNIAIEVHPSGTFTNFEGIIDVPNYLIENPNNIIESEIPETALDLDSDGYSDDVDCNDFDNNTYPGAIELADGLDNNCDGVIPNSESDLDNDGYIESNFDSYIWQGSTSVMGGDDCHDGDATIYPGAPETVIGLDQNCDALFLVDADGDGYASIESGGNDCDDADSTTYPGASETDPNIDSNCDGSFIEVDSVDTSSLVDADGDGYASIESGGNDCDDYNQTIYPGATENWVGVDSNCDTIAAELVLIDAEFCQDMALTSNRVQWSESDQTCIMTEKIELDDSNKVYQTDHTSLILHFKDASGGLVEGSTLRVYAPVILENTLFVNLGNVEVDSSFKIDENSVFYNVGEPITISYQGQSIEFEGSGKLRAVFETTTIDVKGKIKNSNLIQNWGTFEMDMCTGSIENLNGGVFENGDTGVVNQIECDANPLDTTGPVIQVPRDMSFQVAKIGDTGKMNYVVTANDAVDGPVDVVCNPPAGTDFGVGVNTINCVSVDNAGNTSEESFNITVSVSTTNTVTCGTGTQLVNGQCQAINEVTPQPTIENELIQDTIDEIDLMVSIMSKSVGENTQVDLKFNKFNVNYELIATQNGNDVYRQMHYSMGSSATHMIPALGSTDNPVDIKVISMGIGMPGMENTWTGKTGLIGTAKVVPEFGTLTMMILVVAIIGVVAFTSKSKLMPKF